MPIDQNLKIMHWPNDSSANAMLQILQDSLKSSFILSSNAMIDSLSNRGLDFTNANFNSCSQSEGSLSVILIKFTINTHIDSFNIQTIQTDNIYIMLPIEYKSNHEPIISTMFTIIEGKEYSVFRARKDEIENAQKTIFENTDLKKSNLIYTDGLKDIDGNIFLSFIQVGKDENSTILVNMKDWKIRIINE